MKKIFVLGSVCFLVACASNTPAPQVTPLAPLSPASTTPGALTPATPATPAAPATLTSGDQACANLKSQFQTQLPFAITNLFQWQTTTMSDPLQPNSPPLPACVISMHTTGDMVLRQGLASNFMSATLGRLDWMPGPVNYLADSPVGHQEAMVSGNQLAIIKYSFAPPQGACPKNQPIAACKVSKKKWLYNLNATILVGGISSAAVPPQTS